MRRTLIVNREFQVKFIFRFCAIVVAASAILAALVLWFSDNSTTVTIENTKVAVKNTVDFIYPIIFQSVLVATIFSAVCVFFLTMIMTHRVAGPLYRLRQDLEKIKDGDLTLNFKVRKTDQLGDFALALNDTISVLKNRLAKVITETQNMQQALDSSNIDQAKKYAEGIKKALDGLKV